MTKKEFEQLLENKYHFTREEAADNTRIIGENEDWQRELIQFCETENIDMRGLWQDGEDDRADKAYADHEKVLFKVWAITENKDYKQLIKKYSTVLI